MTYDLERQVVKGKDVLFVGQLSEFWDKYQDTSIYIIPIPKQ